MFGGGTEIEVQSSVYNLAGDIEKRPNFLKTLTFSQSMYKTHASMGEAISQSYLGGVGIKLRQLPALANRLDFFNLVGQSTATITSRGNIDHNLIRDALNFRLGIESNIYTVEMSAPVLRWWGWQYLLENHPVRAQEIFEVIMDEDETSMLINFYTDPSDTEPYDTISFPFDISIVDNTADYLFVLYGIRAQPGLIEEVDDPTEEVDDFSAVEGFGDPVSTVNEDTDYEWEEVITVRDVYPDYEDTQEFRQPRLETRNNLIRVYKKTTDIPAVPSMTEAQRIEETYVTTVGFKLVPEVTETVEEFEGFTRYTTVSDYRVEPANFQQYNKKTFEVYKVNDQKVFIHKRGDDPIFDALFGASQDIGQFFPVIPLRYDRRPGTSPRPIFIKDSPDIWDQQIYKKGKRLLGKVTTRKAYEEVIESLKENEDIGDINYIYVLFGSSLNSPANSARKYMMNFFKAFGDYSPESANKLNDYIQAHEVAEQSRDAWLEWNDAQQDPDNPLYATPEPEIIPYPIPPERSVTLKSTARLQLNYNISWLHIHREVGQGKLEGVPVGKVEVEEVSASATGIPTGATFIEIINSVYSLVVSGKNRGPSIKFKYQIDEDNWETVLVYGLYLTNTIHKGESYDINVSMALAKDGESAFIIPLHEIPFRQMSLIDSTQFGSSSMYLLFNYYAETETEWYETGIFQIVITVAVVVVSVAFPPGGAAAAGIGAKVATAIGLTGVTAAVFAAAVNALAGIVISKIVSYAASELLGDEWGIIVGAIVSMVAVTAMQSYFAGKPINLLESFNSTNLLKLAGTMTGDLGKFFQDQAMQIQQQAQAHMEEINKQSEELNKLIAAEYSNRAVIDPMEFYRRIMEASAVFETPDQFFSRTLMTGSDISNISLNALGEVINLDNTLILA